jgi:hypothetical protein
VWRGIYWGLLDIAALAIARGRIECCAEYLARRCRMCRHGSRQLGSPKLVGAQGRSELAVPHVRKAAAGTIVPSTLPDDGRVAARDPALGDASALTLARIRAGLPSVCRRKHAVENLGQTDLLPYPSARNTLLSRVQYTVSVGSSVGAIPCAGRRFTRIATGRRISGGKSLGRGGADQDDEQEHASDHGGRPEPGRSPVASERGGRGAGVAPNVITAATCTSRRSPRRWGTTRRASSSCSRRQLRST